MSEVRLDGGAFWMGSEDGTAYRGDAEGPVRRVEIAPFWIDAEAVSNERFAEFARATGYVTQAERFGWSFVFAGLLPDEFPETRGVVGAEWWRQVFGADWRHPEGPHSNVDARADHPVVHVSWEDAQAFCAWARRRLPSEAEWEYAARGGLEQKRFPWGDDPVPDGVHRCNVWQGAFPAENTLEDGWYGTAPVRAFAPNGYGLYNVVGNAWEWCADGWTRGTRLPTEGTHRVMRGGSYLCHPSYCYRFRVSARGANTPDSATGNLGFRTARDV